MSTWISLDYGLFLCLNLLMLMTFMELDCDGPEVIAIVSFSLCLSLSCPVRIFYVSHTLLINVWYTHVVTVNFNVY